ncbi:hypothetical protein FIBSPDRAFT_925496 [Athelia psychrophila]|uniref:Uncharacterized protein n=1 Tax=Athelia psychrophila TaxID=1759441 RepID=A0A166UX95_9AGAM|nr:hypothetical protein FIBSPDRAFT_925496 [Fibularhizoctonia sp. CBS 109695]
MTGTAMRVWHFEDIPPMVELLIENRADLKERADFMGPALGDGFLLGCKLQLLKNINQRVYEFGNDEGDEEEASEWQEEYAEARETWANAHYDNDGELDSEEEELDPGWETGESLNGEENSDQEMEADQEHPGGEYWLSDDEAENNSFKAIMIREAKAFGLFAFPVGYASGDDSDWHTAEDSDDDSDWHTAEDGERVNDHDVNV